MDATLSISGKASVSGRIVATNKGPVLTVGATNLGFIVKRIHHQMLD